MLNEANLAPASVSCKVNDAARNHQATCPQSVVGCVVFALGMGITFFLFADHPLWHSDLWDHVNYGRHILATNQIPKTEPLMSLAVAAPMIDIAWGSQVVMALLIDSQHFGSEALQFGHAMLIVAAVGVIGWSVVRRTGSSTSGLLASLVMLAVNWQQFLVIRPQMAGVTCFSILLAVVSRGRFSRQSLIFLPVLFAVWSNLHGSFAMGLSLLGLLAAGQFNSTLRRSRSLQLALRSHMCHRCAFLIPLCAAAALLNPNGYLVFPEVLHVGSHPNIASMYEWDPLTLTMNQGKAVLAVCLALLPILALSRRPLRGKEVLPLLFFLVLTFWSSRMVNWLAPILAAFVGLHSASAWRRMRGYRWKSVPESPSALLGVLSISFCLGFGAFSGFGQKILYGISRPPEFVLSTDTPIRTGEFVSNRPEFGHGRIFIPAEWSGYFKFVAPTIEPMVNLHVHLIPEQVWSDYLQLARGSTGAEEILTQYDIRVVVADRRRNGQLIRQLLNSTEIEAIYADRQSRVFRRMSPPAVPR